MSQTIIQMYGAGSGGTESAVANIDIPEDGTIEGIDWAAHAVLNADAEFFIGELSFIATHQTVTNDARGVLSTVRSQMGFITSGMGNTSINKYVFMDVEVAGGERLYLHISAAAGVVSALAALIHFAGRRPVRRRSARRR